MRITRIMIIIVAVLFAAWATFQFELFAGEFRMRFLYLEDWMSLIALTALILAIGMGLKLLASMTAHKKVKTK